MPTRLNPADCPTRDTDLPEPGRSILGGLHDPQASFRLASISSLRHWISNWARLFLLLTPAFILLPCSSRRHSPEPIDLHEWTLDFDSTFGFPGEGPQGLCVWVLLVSTICDHAIGVGVGDASHADAVRREKRTGIVLEDGRRVTEATANVRDVLFERFEGWLQTEGMALHDVLFAQPPDLDLLNRVLVRYGRWSFEQGKTSVPLFRNCQCSSKQAAYGAAFSAAELGSGVHVVIT